MQKTKMTVYNDSEEVIGWISCGSCENPNCTTAVVNGKKWHVIPAGFAVTLSDYHFRTVEDALYALHSVWGS